MIRDRIGYWEDGVPFHRAEAAAILRVPEKTLEHWAGRSMGPDFYAPDDTLLRFYLLADLRRWMDMPEFNRRRVRAAPEDAEAVWPRVMQKQISTRGTWPHAYSFHPLRNQIAHWPEAHSLTRAQLAIFLGVSPRTVEDWEGGPPRLANGRYVLGAVRAWLLQTRRTMTNAKKARYRAH